MAEASLADLPTAPSAWAQELIAKCIAPVKHEFLRQKRTETHDTPASHIGEPVSKRQQKKARTSAINLCNSFVHGRCNFADRCKYSHDLDKYLSQKPADLPGTCPFISTGSCPYGVTCRYARTHTYHDALQDQLLAHAAAPALDEAPQPLAESDVKLAEALVEAEMGSSRAAMAVAKKVVVPAHGPDGVMVEALPLLGPVLPLANALDRELTTKLWKSRYDFDRADLVLRRLGCRITFKSKDGKLGPAHTTAAPVVTPLSQPSMPAQQPQQLGSTATAPEVSTSISFKATADGAGTNGMGGQTGSGEAAGGGAEADTSMEPQQEAAGLNSGLPHCSGPPLKRARAGPAPAGAVDVQASEDVKVEPLAAPARPPAVPTEPGSAPAVPPVASATAAASVSAAPPGEPGAPPPVATAPLNPPAPRVGGMAWRAQHVETGLKPHEKVQLDFRGKTYLAPLTTVGNLPFRRVCKGLGVDITCGEMALATNLLQGQQPEWALLKRHPCEDLFGVQVCGGFPDALGRMAQLLDEYATVDFVDVNMGCPLDLICDKGAGSALLTKPKRIEDITKSMSSLLSCPLTLKLRKGFLDDHDVTHTLIPHIRSWGASAITLHGRTRQQRYSRRADWEYIEKCASLDPELQLVGNGDIFSYEDWNRHMEAGSGLATCMVARGALIKPWIFTEIKEQRHWDISAGERLDLLKQFCAAGLEHWGSDSRGVETTRRFLLEWLSFSHRYIPVGLLEVVPQQMNWRPPMFHGRSDLETLLGSEAPSDWVRISEMLLGRVPPGFTFVAKHKSNAYAASAPAGGGGATAGLAGPSEGDMAMEAYDDTDVANG